MSGIGKTTLAEEIFNKLHSEYDGCYFLANEREQSSKRGIISLKNEIFSELLADAVKVHTQKSLPNDIVRRISRMKVFIVLDDVNDPDHLQNLLGALDNFGSGSRIIVTTRDKQVLNANKADEIYHLREFSFDKSLEFFNLIVFNQGDQQRDDISKKIVHYAQGIPLVLKVLAHLLRKKDKEVWESELDKLKKLPPSKVYDVMKLSYDDLDRKEKQIFLDLACFILRLHKKVNVGNAKSLLKDGKSDNSVVVGLERLKDNALITFSEDNFICMHDSLQEMGLEIVRRKSIKDSRSCSWLWDPDDICEALKNNKGIEAIRSIQIDLTKMKEQKLSPHIFTHMSRLRFLEIYNDLYEHNTLVEGLQLLATELRFLCWYSYSLKSLPENFSVEKLVILKLPFSKMEKLWDGVKNLVSLKELDLNSSEKLKELPDLSKAINLETILLWGRSRLTRVHSSIFSLEKLEKLDLWNCKSLTIFASDSHICNLSYLNLDDCGSLGRFSLISENMKELRLQHTKVKTLPLSFGNQGKLKSLHLTASDIERLPSSFNNLIKLLHLEVSNCRGLQTIPELPPFLETLNVEHCTSLQTIEKLSPSLKILNAKCCYSLQTLPELPSSLKTLAAQFCESLQSLPELPPSLKTLNVESSISLQSLPELPTSLETLNVQQCCSLQTIPELSPSIETLNVFSCTSLETIAKLSPSLKILEAQHCKSLQSLPEFPQSLKTLNVNGCHSLQTLLELPPSLETLNTQNCRSLQTIPELPLSLKTLDFHYCNSLQSLPRLPMFLKTLDANRCGSLQSVLALPLFLKTLDFQFCSSLQSLPELPPFLETLHVRFCKSLQALPELPLSLKTLDVRHCASLQTIPKLPSSLNTLDCRYCYSLQSPLELPFSLETLNATKCNSLRTLLFFPVMVVEQLRVLLWNCLNIDEQCLVDIGMNAQINVMKLANKHLSTQNHNLVNNYNDYDGNHFPYKVVFVYPGNSVPEWFEYKTTKDYIVIDLSSAPPYPFLASFSASSLISIHTTL